MLTDTPTPTTVVTPRFRSIGSSWVPVIGPSPWWRASTTSRWSMPISSGTPTASDPGDSCTGAFRTPANSRALRLAPVASSRVSAVQWKTGTPAARAATASAAQCGTRSTRAPAAASSGSTDGVPTTPFCTSWRTSAVCAGATSAVRSRGTTSLLGELHRVGLGEHRLDHLPERVARQRLRADLPVRGHFVVGEGLRTERPELIGVERHTGHRHHDRLDLLAEHVVVDADDRDLRDVRVG